MKIRSIRLTNLNSLKGTHHVDLMSEPLASAGLFAITGPTGAGKSTLLDAVTLALYGKAARYGNAANPDDVMSRHCGECSAEVEFQVPSGIYRAVWKRSRAHKKPDGKLQSPTRHIYNFADEIVAEQIREAEEKIEELLGLNYDRFLRSVLLAQGDFARFLKASANERAELLENLTGTEIYTRLGEMAHEEASSREATLQQKTAGLEQIPVLEEIQRTELERHVKGIQQRIEELTKGIKDGATMVANIDALRKARAQEKKALQALELIQSKYQQVAADLEALRLHRLTQPFIAEVAKLGSAEEACNRILEDRKKAEAKHAADEKALAKAHAILRATLETALAARQGELQRAQKEIAQAAQDAGEARVWLDANKGDAGLAGSIGDLTVGLVDLQKERSSLSADWKKWKKSALEILPEVELPGNLAGEDAPILDGVLKKAGAKQAELEKGCDGAKKELARRKDHLLKAQQIASLEERRSDLKRGEPCPLCGALEHPFAEEGVLGLGVAELQAAEHEANQVYELSRTAFESLAAAVKALTSHREELFQKLGSVEAGRTRLEQQLKPFALSVPAQGEEEELRQQLEKRKQAYAKHSEQEAKADIRKQSAQNTIELATEACGKIQQSLKDLPEATVDAGSELPTLAQAETNYKKAVNDEGVSKGVLVERIRDQERLKGEFEQLKSALEPRVGQSEFGTLEQLRAAVLDSTRAGELEKLETKLKEEKTQQNTLLTTSRKDIGDLLKKAVLEDEAAELFQQTQKKLEEEKSGLLQEKGQRENQLSTDSENRKKRQATEEELKVETQRLVVWRRLRELIGSHDGAKFRRYAQAVSLDILTRHANRHLTKLSDRYRICRQPGEELNLHIEDLHQAGVKRPMASLSGGESFLVSLALALGLSDLAGRTVRIDSLFIDEGFGSLDSDSLEVAIGALESLRQNHKTVGVISHIPLLKERIGTQIVVEKQTGGVSRIRVAAS